MKTIFVLGLFPDRNQTFLRQLTERFHVVMSRAIEPWVEGRYPVTFMEDLVPPFDQQAHNDAFLGDFQELLQFSRQAIRESGFPVPASLAQENQSRLMNLAYHLSHHAQVFRNLLTSTPIDLVIVNADYSAYRRPFVLEAQKRGVPTLCIDHGFYNIFPEPSAYRVPASATHFRFISDYVIVDNPLEVDILEAHRALLPGRKQIQLLPLGTPNDVSFNQKMDKKLAAERLSVRPDLFTVTIIGSFQESLLPSKAIQRQIDQIDFYETVFEELSKIQQSQSIQVLVKLHPALASNQALTDTTEYLRSLAQEKSLKVASISIQYLEETLAISDLLIAHSPSSVLWEGFLGKTPGIIFPCKTDLEMLFEPDRLNSSNLLTREGCIRYVRDAAELRGELMDFLNSETYDRVQERIERLCEEFEVSHDSVDEKSRRICDYIETIPPTRGTGPLSTSGAKPERNAPLSQDNSYYQHTRPEVQALVPRTTRKLLDVGCASGALGQALKEQLGCYVVGIEYVPEVAEEARAKLDEVHSGDAVTAMTAMPAHQFDCIIFADVLEHLVDPERCLLEAKRILAPGGTIVASIPNVRHWSVLKGLLEGHWDYQDSGILDRTHLRFFTRESMIRMFQESGFHVNALTAMVTPGLGAPSGLADLLGQMGVDASTLEEEGRVFQFLLTAAPVASLDVPERSEKRVSIVIPLFNKVEFTQRCLEALVENTPPDLFEVILVDNASSDGTAELLACLEGDVQIIRNPRNMGFARACNQGAQAATGKYVVFLNNDTLPQPGWLEALLDEAERDPEVGIVGCKLLYPDTGKIQHAGIGWINGLPDHPYRHADPEAVEVNQVRDLDMVTGACLLIKRNVFHEVGGFDEGYLNGVEDIDLCLQVKRAGYRVRYAPKSVLFHFEGTSEGRFDHVAPNLQRFFTRWQGCFTPEGRFVPPAKPLPVQWEGSQFVYHSLAHVNRELTRALIGSAALDLAVIPYESHQFNADDQPALRPIEQRIGRRLQEPVRVHVRHQWPPKFEPPSEGAWVMIQPWEFGGIPQEWIAPMRDQVDEIWVPTSWVRDCYIQSGIPAAKVVVVPNGVNTDLYHPDGACFPLKTRKRFKFLFLGGAIARKGIDVLLETYVKTFSRHDDVCLVIKTNGANGHYRGSALDEEIKRIAADPAAPEIEYVEQDLSDAEVAALYRACDALVHPYRGEGFGMPIAEAMACALPVIVTGYGACLDFCDEETAYLVPAREVAIDAHSLPEPSIGYWWAEPDREALADIMRTVLAHPEQARSLGRKARHRMVEQFQWSHVAQIALARIQELASRTPLRFVQGGPFRPGVSPLTLEDRRTVAFFHHPEWRNVNWKQVLLSYVRAFESDEDVSLVFWLDPAQGLSVEEAQAAIVGVLNEEGADASAIPDLLIVPEALDLMGLASLYAAVDCVVPAGDPTQAARALQLGLGTLDDLSKDAWQQAFQSRFPASLPAQS